MLFDRPPGARRIPMQIRSAYALIAVRGTQFFAGPSNGVFGVFVRERDTRSLRRRPDGHVDGRPGHQSAEPRRRADALPVNWGQPRIDAAYQSVR